MAAQPQQHVTPEQYLELERAAENRHEYFAGQMFAMAGASYAHTLILSNFSWHIRNSVHAKGCAVLVNDLRMRVSPSGLYTYPDIVVVCGEPKFVDDRKDTITNPVVIIEVLSPSTEAYDRGFKSGQYRTIESLEAYVLVSQSEARVEVFQRQTSGGWLLTEFLGIESTCALASIDSTVALRDIYDGVTFEPIAVREPDPPTA